MQKRWIFITSVLNSWRKRGAVGMQGDTGDGPGAKVAVMMVGLFRPKNQCAISVWAFSYVQTSWPLNEKFFFSLYEIYISTVILCFSFKEKKKSSTESKQPLCMRFFREVGKCTCISYTARKVCVCGEEEGWFQIQYSPSNVMNVSRKLFWVESSRQHSEILSILTIFCPGISWNSLYLLWLCNITE